MIDPRFRNVIRLLVLSLKKWQQWLNDEPCMVRSAIIGMNPVELKYYPFIISLNKWAGNFNVLSPKICVPKESKNINVEAFKVHILWDCKYKFNSTTCNSKQKWNDKHVNANVKITISVKKIIFGILAHVFVRVVSI